MFCPNCGSANDERQNYCRFCGLNLRDAAASLATQIETGNRSESLQKFRTVKRVIDLASAILVVSLILVVIVDIFFIVDVSKEVLSTVIGLFAFLQIAQLFIGFRNRESRNKDATAETTAPSTLNAMPTAQLLPESEPKPAASIVENTTDLLPRKIERK